MIVHVAQCSTSFKFVKDLIETSDACSIKYNLQPSCSS